LASRKGPNPDDQQAGPDLAPGAQFDFDQAAVAVMGDNCNVISPPALDSRGLMLKRILVLLGETRASVVARQYALRLARAESAELAGIAGIDLAFIESPMVGGIGTTAYKMHLEEGLRAQAKDACARLRDVYEKECRTNNAPFEWLEFDGDPIGALRIAAESSDALVTGHDTAFRGNIRERLPDMLAKLC
jgi:hypothetical protein